MSVVYDKWKVWNAPRWTVDTKSDALAETSYLLKYNAIYDSKIVSTRTLKLMVHDKCEDKGGMKVSWEKLEEAFEWTAGTKAEFKIPKNMVTTPSTCSHALKVTIPAALKDFATVKGDSILFEGLKPPAGEYDFVVEAKTLLGKSIKDAVTTHKVIVKLAMAIGMIGPGGGGLTALTVGSALTATLATAAAGAQAAGMASIVSPVSPVAPKAPVAVTPEATTGGSSGVDSFDPDTGSSSTAADSANEVGGESEAGSNNFEEESTI